MIYNNNYGHDSLQECFDANECSCINFGCLNDCRNVFMAKFPNLQSVFLTFNDSLLID